MQFSKPVKYSIFIAVYQIPEIHIPVIYYFIRIYQEEIVKESFHMTGTSNYSKVSGGKMKHHTTVFKGSIYP